MMKIIDSCNARAANTITADPTTAPASPPTPQIPPAAPQPTLAGGTFQIISLHSNKCLDVHRDLNAGDAKSDRGKTRAAVSAGPADDALEVHSGDSGDSGE